MEVKFLERRPGSLFEFNQVNPEIGIIHFDQVFVRNVRMCIEGKHQFKIVHPPLPEIRKQHGKIKKVIFVHALF